MSGRLYLTLPQMPEPRSRMLWDALAIRLDVEWVIRQHALPQVRISDGHRSLVVPISPPEPIRLQQLQSASGSCYSLLANRPLTLRQAGSDHWLNADVFTPMQRMTALMLEDGMLPRAGDGTLAGASYAMHGFDAAMLGIDYVGELATLVSDVLLYQPTKAWQAFAPQAPYALVVTFDCDGFLPGQPDALRRFLDTHEIVRPTVFVMAPDRADAAIYDPRYDPTDPELRTLYEISEIGLHSSYRAYNDGAIMAAQKARLEDAIGGALHGHRSHYLRFGFPYTWGYVAQAGFSYDMTMGFYDLPGHRQGGTHPIPFADPAGRGRQLWSWGVGLMDQHLFMPGSPLAWSEGAGKAALANRLAQLRKTGGTLVLDWHVHCINSEQFPHHFEAFTWLIEEARRDGAWIGGAGMLLDQYRARASARQLAAQVSMQTKELQVGSPETLNTSHYLQGSREANLTSVNYIDAGAHSFLAALPSDAVRVADIGCGSGWVSHRVPPLRQVLGVDIDEGITRRISRRGIVGSLPNLPLEDGQADLVLCTDVIEHLTPVEVAATGFEFDRVSTRYAYLQTPHRERLDDGDCFCRACDARWHVNHHLAAHDAASLAQVMPAGWYPHTITYTGEVQPVDSSLRNAGGELLGAHPMRGQRYTCPTCGHVNETDPAAHDPRLAEAQTKERLPLPFYSEVAVMAARSSVTRQWEDSQPILVSRQGTRELLPRPHLGNSHTIDFRKPVEEVATVAATYHIPSVVLQDGSMLQSEAGTELVTSGLTWGATLLMLFPDQHPAGERFIVTGEVLSPEPVSLTLQAFNWESKDCGSTQAMAGGAFALEMSFDRPAYCVALYVNQGHRIRLHQARVTGRPRPLFLYDVGTRFAYGHVQLHRRGTCWRWQVPAQGRLWADRPFHEQIADDMPRERHAEVGGTSTMNLKDFHTSPVPVQALLSLAADDEQNPCRLIGAAICQPQDIQEHDIAAIPQAPLLALVAFSAVEAEMLMTAKRSPLARLVLRYDRRIGAVLKRVLPLDYYRKLRMFYPRLLRRLTNPQQ
ncbi:methyltransferase domain-containing protein [Achromobacter xylosoxidans]